MDTGIPEFFQKKNILITGGTGFIGKVLVEKLLRSCPLVGKIYVLTRKGRSGDIAERWRQIWEMPLFDVIRKEHPDTFEQIVPIAGDVTELGLGMSEADTKCMIDNVDVIFHGAATVRFDQPLMEAVIMNTRGTRELCLLALKMKKLQVFVHISTAYTQTKEVVIKEQVYPPHADWKKTIEIAENMDNETFKVISRLYRAGFPNTYSFTKSLSENVVHDMLNNKVPNIIIRPTIVISTVEEPFRGWVDNLNGPVGLCAAVATGLIRIVLCDPEQKPDYVFVDCFVKIMLTATWYEATKTCMSKETYVLNVGSKGYIEMTANLIKTISDEQVWRIPQKNMMWMPRFTFTTSNIVFHAYFVLLQLIPALFLDGLLKLKKAKPKVVRLQRQFYNLSQVFQYYLINEWVIENDKMSLLQEELLPKDKDTFRHFMNDFEPEDELGDVFCGVKTYVLKESIDEDTLRPLKRRLIIFWVLDKALQILTYVGYFYMAKWMLYKLLDSMTNYWYSV